MKHLLSLAVAVLLLPAALFASSTASVDLTNVGGTITSMGNGGLALTNSVLVSFDGIVGGDLGSVTFTTGALTSGSLQYGGTFAAGGTFSAYGNGTDGMPNGVLFSGTLTSATWTLVTLSNGTHEYILSGTLEGTLGNGATSYGTTVQLTVNTGTGYFTGSTLLSSGDSNVVVPEPGSLTLLGTGLLGIAGIIRHKMQPPGQSG
ncbi:MAG TPA: PEP-CTERM sorting domain-containing protein [Candidatus Sulfotelmatobacter sp.]|nr:PEP-CTERM sorting domain-containing protein [Candidatus Sulfotelmatobacter sp.]